MEENHYYIACTKVKINIDINFMSVFIEDVGGDGPRLYGNGRQQRKLLSRTYTRYTDKDLTNSRHNTILILKPIAAST